MGVDFYSFMLRNIFLLSVSFSRRNTNLYENIIEFFVLRISIADNARLIRSRYREYEDRVSLCEHGLVDSFDLGAYIPDHTIRVMNLIDTVLHPTTILSDELRESCPCLIVRDVI